jgi:hypothetical protein
MLGGLLAVGGFAQPGAWVAEDQAAPKRVVQRAGEDRPSVVDVLA